MMGHDDEHGSGMGMGGMMGGALGAGAAGLGGRTAISQGTQIGESSIGNLVKFLMKRGLSKSAAIKMALGGAGAVGGGLLGSGIGSAFGGDDE